MVTGQGGDGVNIAARLENSGDRMRVNCSEETKSFLKKSYDYELKKDVELKGKGKAQIFVIKKEAW